MIDPKKWCPVNDENERLNRWIQKPKGDVSPCHLWSSRATNIHNNQFFSVLEIYKNDTTGMGFWADENPRQPAVWGFGGVLSWKKGMNITMSQFKITCDMFLGMRDRATRLPTQPSGDSALGRSPAAQGIQFPTHASCNGLENHGSMSSMSSMGHCVHVLSHPNNSGAQKDNELQDLRRKYVF